MRPPRITTQRELRREFWATFPSLPRRKITDFSGNGKMHLTNTRVAWCDWIDALAKSGDISILHPVATPFQTPSWEGLKVYPDALNASQSV